MHDWWRSYVDPLPRRGPRCPRCRHGARLVYTSAVAELHMCRWGHSVTDEELAGAGVDPYRPGVDRGRLSGWIARILCPPDGPSGRGVRTGNPDRDHDPAHRRGTDSVLLATTHEHRKER